MEKGIAVWSVKFVEAQTCGSRQLGITMAQLKHSNQNQRKDKITKVKVLDT